MDAPSKTHPNPDPYIGSPRYPTNQKPQSSSSSKPAPQAQAAPAAAKPQSHPWSGSSPAAGSQPSQGAPWPGLSSAQAPVVTSVGEVSQPAPQPTAPLASRPYPERDAARGAARDERAGPEHARAEPAGDDRADSRHAD